MSIELLAVGGSMAGIIIGWFLKSKWGMSTEALMQTFIDSMKDGKIDPDEAVALKAAIENFLKTLKG